MLSKALKQEIINHLSPLNPRKIILFGSYAHGVPSRESDIDLLVITDDDFYPQTFDESMNIRLKFSKALFDFRKEYPVDLIVHTKPMYEKFVKLGSSLSKEISLNGQILYERVD